QPSRTGALVRTQAASRPRSLGAFRNAVIFRRRAGRGIYSSISVRAPWHNRRAAARRIYQQLARPVAPRQSRDLHRREQSIAGGRLSAIVLRTLGPALAGPSLALSN